MCVPVYAAASVSSSDLYFNGSVTFIGMSAAQFVLSPALNLFQSAIAEYLGTALQATVSTNNVSVDSVTNTTLSNACLVQVRCSRHTLARGPKRAHGVLLFACGPRRHPPAHPMCKSGS